MRRTPRRTSVRSCRSSAHAPSPPAWLASERQRSDAMAPLYGCEARALRQICAREHTQPRICSCAPSALPRSHMSLGSHSSQPIKRVALAVTPSTMLVVIGWSTAHKARRRDLTAARSHDESWSMALNTRSISSSASRSCAFRESFQSAVSRASGAGRQPAGMVPSALMTCPLHGRRRVRCGTDESRLARVSSGGGVRAER